MKSGIVYQYFCGSLSYVFWVMHLYFFFIFNIFISIFLNIYCNDAVEIIITQIDEEIGVWIKARAIHLQIRCFRCRSCIRIELYRG